MAKSKRKINLARNNTKKRHFKKVKKVNKISKRKYKKVSKRNKKNTKRKGKKAGQITTIQNIGSRYVNTIQQIMANLSPEKIQFLGVLMITKEDNIRLIYNLFSNNNNNTQVEQLHTASVKNLYNNYRKYDQIMPFINPNKYKLCTSQINNQKNSDRTVNFKNAFILGGPSSPMSEQGKFSLISDTIFYRSNIVLMQLILYRLFEPNPNNLFLEILAYIIYSAKNGQQNQDTLVDFLTNNINVSNERYFNQPFSRSNSVEDDLRLRVSQAFQKYNVEGTNLLAPAKITERYMLASLVSTISIYNVNNGNNNIVKANYTNDIQCSGFLSEGINYLVTIINNPQNFQNFQGNITNKWNQLLSKRKGYLGISTNFNVNLGLGGNYDIFRNGILQKQTGIVFPSILELFTFLFAPKVNYNNLTQDISTNQTNQTNVLINNEVNMQAEATSITGYFTGNKYKINSSSHRDEFRLIFKDKINELLNQSSGIVTGMPVTGQPVTVQGYNEQNIPMAVPVSGSNV